ncbi:MAG: RNA polymerase sigma factor [Proteobacteria bacterium]|nr:RNA polymerase sigma factor [Pseudomonadota bacterium]
MRILFRSAFTCVEDSRLSTKKAAATVIYLDACEDIRRHERLVRIVEEHEIALRRFLRIRLANRSDREEIVQEVFVRLCRHANLEDKVSRGVESTRAYLFKIATNLIRDMNRRAKVRYSDKHEYFNDQTAADKRPSVESQVQTSQTLDQAVGIIDSLPKKCAQAFILSRFRGMSYREISERMGVSCSMVEKHISAALFEIRNELVNDHE